MVLLENETYSDSSQNRSLALRPYEKIWDERQVRGMAFMAKLDVFTLKSLENEA